MPKHEAPKQVPKTIGTSGSSALELPEKIYRKPDA